MPIIKIEKTKQNQTAFQELKFLLSAWDKSRSDSLQYIKCDIKDGEKRLIATDGRRCHIIILNDTFPEIESGIYLPSLSSLIICFEKVEDVPSFSPIDDIFPDLDGLTPFRVDMRGDLKSRISGTYSFIIKKMKESVTLNFFYFSDLWGDEYSIYIQDHDYSPVVFVSKSRKIALMKLKVVNCA